MFFVRNMNSRMHSRIEVISYFQIPMVIHVYHPYRQPDGHNHCLPLNGRCSHICLPAPRITANSAKTSCACPRGLKLDKDNLNCIHDRTFYFLPFFFASLPCFRGSYIFRDHCPFVYYLIFFFCYIFIFFVQLGILVRG